MLRATALFVLAATLARAHGDHGDNHALKIQALAEDESLSYAERHMAAEHHIETFDLPSFFKLHDLNSDGFWDQEEIASLYGLKHHSVSGEKNQHKTEPDLERRIVTAVLLKLDRNGDGRVSLDELKLGGQDSLPLIGDFKHLGHHYDEESEYFLHHEELYHNTPETQTDESYNHPEDIEHFMHHEHIEEEEDARERKFQALPEDADLEADHPAHDPLAEHAHPEGEGPEAYAASGQGPDVGGGETWEEQTSGGESEGDLDADELQKQRLRDARAGRKGGATPPRRITTPPSGKRNPHSHEDRVRADAPYKYKIRAGLRSDEF